MKFFFPTLNFTWNCVLGLTALQKLFKSLFVLVNKNILNICARYFEAEIEFYMGSRIKFEDRIATALKIRVERAQTHSNSARFQVRLNVIQRVNNV